MGWRLYVVSAIVAYVACFIYYIDFSNESPILRLNGIEFIKHHGYEGEEHLVESKDGLYMIKLHRIGKGENPMKTIVLFIPGMHGSSELQFALGPEYDLSYMAYNSGIDPWMANSRGSHNAKPKENTTLTNDDLTNFSFHEIALHDISAQIDYILQKTEKKNLQVIAGSMGAYVILTLLAYKPEYNNKVSKVLLMGPAGPFTSATTYIQHIVAKILNFNKGVADYVSMSYKHREDFAHILCTHPLIPISCKKSIDMYLGFNFDAIPDGLEAVALKVMFTGPWTGIYEHFFQTFIKKRYIMRDYGKMKNLKVYGSETPPDYKMSSITVPVKIYLVEGDFLFTEESIKEMMEQIPNIKDVYTIGKPFKHGNLITGAGIDKKLVTDVLSTLHRETL